MKSLLFAAALAPLAVAQQPTESEPRDVTLVVYDSFPTEGTHVDALERFSVETGIDVELLVAGDTGTMVAKAVLTAGNPEGDVMWGVDNTYLSRVVDDDVFDPYEADGLDNVGAELQALVPGHEATPVDFGDVCVNYDIGWFADHGIEPPTDLAALTSPEYADLLVVQNPASSSPGLAFLMATVAEFGDDGWVDYWERLVANGVEVVDGWTEAYYERFSGASDGPRPLVVSYGTSPPVEVIYADPPVEEASTAVVVDTCFRQIEFAGVLNGTDAPDEARRLVDFLISEEFQAQVALTLFVYPAHNEVELPAAFTDFSVIAEDAYSLDPATIDGHRDDWIDTWTDVVLR
ncbi:MAG TPA: thiamine ABC transporter substrate-binding protein [Desertimonas sp.]|nr:thiamine ABC transporter substrate-binding protein [Desertimonas sp.]